MKFEATSHQDVTGKIGGEATSEDVLLPSQAGPSIGQLPKRAGATGNC